MSKKYSDSIDTLRTKLAELLTSPNPPPGDVQLAGVIALFAIAQRLERIADNQEVRGQVGGKSNKWES